MSKFNKKYTLSSNESRIPTYLGGIDCIDLTNKKLYFDCKAVPPRYPDDTKKYECSVLTSIVEMISKYNVHNEMKFIKNKMELQKEVIIEKEKLTKIYGSGFFYVKFE